MKRLMSFLFAILFVFSMALLAWFSPYILAANYSYKIIIYPDQYSHTTEVRGINNKGQVVGYYDSASKSFIYDSKNDSYKKIEFAGASRIHAYNIDDSGKIVGTYWDAWAGEDSYNRYYTESINTVINDDIDILMGTSLANEKSHGFLYDGVSADTIDYPDASWTYVVGINNHGQMVGYSSENFLNDGFLYDGDIFTSINIGSSRIPEDINDQGQIIGLDCDLIDGDDIVDVRHPDADGTGPNLTYGINNHGQVAGVYHMSRKRHGYIYTNGNYETIDCPMLSMDYALDINDYGQIIGVGIIGYQEETDYPIHASYIATPGIDVQVSASKDDAVERPTDGEVWYNTPNLKMVIKGWEGYRQTVGIRFTGVDIPQGAFITKAYIQFTTRWAHSVLTTLFIEGHDTDNAPQFIYEPWNISSRARTANRLPWFPPPWTTIGESGPDQRTSDISLVIKEIVDRPGWSSGNALAFIIEGTGAREAYSFDEYPDGAPLLHVEYILPGTVWRVNPNGTDPADCSGGDTWSTGFNTIQKAIDCATAGDEIWVKDGTYYYPAIEVDKVVGIYGGFDGSETERHQRDPEANVTTVYRGVFTVTADPTIDGFFITGGFEGYGADHPIHADQPFGYYGGGISVLSGSPTIANCNFSANWAEYGGAIYSAPNTSLIVTDCIFADNYAEYSGGALYTAESAVSLINCTFSDNRQLGLGPGVGGIISGGGSLAISGCTFIDNLGPRGGAIYASGVKMDVTDSYFTQNGSRSAGGAITIGSDGDTVAHISNCTFEENFSDYDGGAISLFGASADDRVAVISNSKFISNSSHSRVGGGSGAINVVGGQPLIENCLFSGNGSDFYGSGGAILNRSQAAPIIINCTFHGNRVFEGGSGGAIANFDNAAPTIINSILYGNTASDGTQISGGSPTVSYSDIDQDGYEGVDGNIRQDPLFVSPGYWDDNGTPEYPGDDFWVDGDYHLQSTSPCIDAGTDSTPALPLLDFEGDPRIIDSAPDMGADEVPCTVSTYYRDADGDGYGDPNASKPTPRDCSQPTGYVEDNTDCDDNDVNEHPGQTWYKDADNDGYSDGTKNTTSCNRPVGYKVQSELTATSGDCKDNDPNVNPGVTEVCNDKDDNCDGKVDEGFDVDKDGYKTCEGDCDDSDPAIHPGAKEVCNGKDDDCDGSIDEGVQTTYFRDADGDGYGDPNNWTKACSQPSGYALNDLDCDDTDPNEHPDQIWYKDLDSDGYSDGSTNTVMCTRPIGFRVASELTSTSGDCDDTDQNKYPGAPEACNGEDDDCDGETDEGCVFNNPPEADAGPDQTVVEGKTVKLDGSKSSDPDTGDNIKSYQWTQLGGIPVTLSDPTAVKPKFVTPIVSPGGMILTFNLMVKDKGDFQDNDQVTVTVNDNGISGFPDDVLTMTCSTGKEIGIKVESDLVSITTVDPATIPDSSDKPDNLPYGLFDLLIKADAVGGTAKVTFYLESKAGDNDKWSKHKTSTGKWEDCGAYATFNAARDRVTLTLVDGGDGDDGPADGWIVDPSGLNASVSASTSPSGGGGGGGGGGCFIATVAGG